MTDTIAPTDSETKPEQAPYISDHKIGDTIQIGRGRHAHKTGEIIARNDEDSTFVVKFPDGKFVVSGQANVKAPESPRVEVSLLVAALQGVPDSNATQRVISALESVAPGIREQIALSGE